ncbi:hypothetical protein MtrunA17_Chr2g0282391 [Medicago truncatula]|uniref:Uncharacterized protein n=1 Tax=Medicago truncatula TaxID=3880 RepID=A0A396J5P0_MEDTR|nr:hypothetical protein MtrunA17_Chr2g0282391 [Medicago truncatula]
MKYLLQFPCCSCFCFVTPKKEKHKEKKEANKGKIFSPYVPHHES